MGSKSGVFYDRLVGWFDVGPSQESFEIGWQMGPRFGQGFVYRIELDDDGNGYRLGEPQPRWAS